LPNTQFLGVTYNKDNNKFENVFSAIYSIENLDAVLFESKFKNTISGWSCRKEKTLSDRGRIEKISKQLQVGTYNYRTIKKVSNLKQKKSGKVSIFLENFQNNLIKQAIFKVLEKIYEGAFF
jgi:hypothetical protein